MASKQISDFDKGRIVAYDDCGWNQRQIGEKIGVTHVAVGKFLKKYKSTGEYERKE